MNRKWYRWHDKISCPVGLKVDFYILTNSQLASVGRQYFHIQVKLAAASFHQSEYCQSMLKRYSADAGRQLRGKDTLHYHLIAGI
ncbi:MAG: hypothetical protein A3H35_12250 [Betaproteobacteria bacterium RIFCSPLOWO2_02_FULL_62_17]|nr:MAG: hypothetical protein A3H35_12250 [Betaproteobacteria bacterium RIFCSPLOWO2_02_FULL_62_17]